MSELFVAKVGRFDQPGYHFKGGQRGFLMVAGWMNMEITNGS